MFKKKEQEQKVKGSQKQKVIRVLLIVFMAFILLRGVTSVLRPNSTVTAREVIESYTSQKGYKEKVEFEAPAFAKMFATEYFTYDTTTSSDESYIERLKKYTNIEFPQPSGNAKSEVINIEAYRVEWRGDKTVNVDCKVKVRCAVKQVYTYQIPQSTPSGYIKPSPPPALKQVDEIYMRVPVAESNGKYIVDGYPLFLPGEDRSSESTAAIKGTDVSEDVQKEITSMLESFLKTYCIGNSTEISYFLQDSGEPYGLNGKFSFKELKRNDLQIKESGGQYLVSAVFTVENAAGIEFLQGIQLIVIEKDKKYLIVKYNSKI
ncbi:MAG: conjugal transfer protein [Clostridia bacterium]|nr:conjugal transfer protein [Clostridia bacterium]